MVITLILLIAALVCFLLATFSSYAAPGWRISVGWLGLAFCTIAWMVGTIPHG